MADVEMPSSKAAGGTLRIEVQARAVDRCTAEERVCVIGAGKSGLIASKVLKQRGVPFDCFEAGSQVGGLWVLNNDSGRSAAYESLCINTSKGMTSFHDFPMPRHYPTFASREQIVQYLELYVDHFGLREHLVFRTEVLSVLPLAGGRHLVTTMDLATGAHMQRIYTAVVVANGHHWDPAWPELPGSFAGTLLHSHEYRSPAAMVGKRVCVIGAGNSGMDIAAEAAQYGAAAVLLSCRRQVHVVPRHIFCVPSDAVLLPCCGVTCHRRVQEAASTLLIRLSRGAQRSFNFPPPDFGLLRAHPTISPGSGDILRLIKQGKVQPRPGIQNIDGRTMRFTDGTSEEVDIIVCATGYNVTCPFLPPGLEVVREDRPELLLNVAHPAHAGLFFLGFVQAHGPMIPCVESQMGLVADLIQGVAELPSEEQMKAAIDAQVDFTRRQFTQVKRHALMVEFHRYLLQLQLARCPKHKGWLGRKLWKTKTFITFCLGKTC